VRVPPQIKHLHEILAQNAELTARLKLSDDQLRKLQQRQEQLEQPKDEKQRLSERVLLLQEEVRWYKEQFFGRSSQKSPAEMSAEQKLLFNEAEVLAAIEAADAAQAARSTKIAAHERKAHSGGREVIPEHLPRKEILHDLPNAQKYCEHEGACWAMERIGEEFSERYHYEPPLSPGRAHRQLPAAHPAQKQCQCIAAGVPDYQQVRGRDAAL
jgi:transposase